MTTADEVRAELEQLVESWLGPHLDRLNKHTVTPRPKIVNDPLWGSIRLYSWEVALLDTYLVQRLRTLKQLGVIHWVFPAAGHSRLEHSLGALHQMTELLDGLERTSGRAGMQVVDDASRKLLRIAALLHDTGHSVMSHVSEGVIKGLPGMPELVAAVRAEHGTTKKISVSEAIASVFVRSPAFKRFLASPAIGADFIADIVDATDQISRFILGAPVRGKETLSLLMSGAFDADKLDYMARDSMMAGIPSAVDVSRIVEKVHAFDVPLSAVPEAFRAVAASRKSTTRIIALSRAGERALSEIAIARTLLFDKLYYHHKVRSLEVTVRRLLQEIKVNGRISRISDWLELTDESLLLRSEPDAVRLRHRNLLKRAFVISPPDEPHSDRDASQTELPLNIKGSDRDWRRLRSALVNGSLETEIRREAETIAKLLGMLGPGQSIDVAVDEPDLTRVGLDQPAFVGDGPGDFRTADAAMTGERAEVAKRLARAKAHVLTDEAFVLPVFLASRHVLLRSYGQEYDQACYASTKLDLDTIVEADKLITERGYYNLGRKPKAMSSAKLRPHREVALEAFLKNAWSRIEQLGSVFGRYQSQGSAPVDAVAIASYLRQFESEERARACLRLIEQIDFKDRKFFADALVSLLKVAKAKVPVLSCLCPMGATGDSSALFTYLMNDVPRELRVPVEPLELALERYPDGPLLLCDDFCGDGGHSITTIGQWLGMEREDLPLDERLVDALSEARLAAFKSRRIFVGFAMARPTGLGKLRSFLLSQGLSQIEVLEPMAPCPDQDVTFAGPRGLLSLGKDFEELKEFLAKTGERLLAPKTVRAHRKWDDEKLKQRVLGYGNTSQLLVFYYNVPTITLTALWASGGGWNPLFHRREKPGSDT